MSDAPKRWLEEGSGSSARVRELLASAPRTPVIPPEIQASSAAKVATLAGKSALGVGAKVLLALVTLGAGVMLYQAGVFERSDAPAADDAEVEAAEVQVDERAEPRSPEVLPALTAAEESSEADESADPTPSGEPSRTPSATRALEGSANEERPNQATLATEATASETGASETGASETGASETGASETGASDPTEPDVEVDPQDNLAAEVALLERARANLVRDPATALEAAIEHLRTYPHGQLSAPAQLVAIDALLRLNRRGEAVAHARAMLQRFPGSIYRERLVRLVGEEALE